MSLAGEGIMILGTFRSGTSSVAAMLSNLGVYFGEDAALCGANEHNPGGHFELNELIDLDDNIFDAFGMKYYSGGMLPENWQELPTTPMILPSVQALLAKHFSGQKLFAWKEPDATPLVPVFQAALAKDKVQLRYAICVRHPLSVIASMQKRMKTPGKMGPGNGPLDHSRIDIRMMGVWLDYTLASLKDTIGERRQIFWYEGLLENPTDYVDRATELMDATATAAQKKASIASVHADWSHSKFSVDDLREWPSIVSRVYDLCLRADADSKEFAKGSFDSGIEALWAEWKRERKMMRPALAPAEEVRFSWKHLSGTSEAFSPLSADDGWSTVNVLVTAVPGTAVIVNPYRSPCQVWIRKAVWRLPSKEVSAVLKAGANAMLQEVYSMKLLTVFGPNPLVVEMPVETATLEMEILVQADRDVLVNLIPVLSDLVNAPPRPR